MRTSSYILSITLFVGFTFFLVFFEITTNVLGDDFGLLLTLILYGLFSIVVSNKFSEKKTEEEDTK